MNWVLHPFRGIESDGVAISFGQARAVVRDSLASIFESPCRIEAYPDEDDFKTLDDSTFIRVRYDDADAVWDIEFLAGTLRYEATDLHDHTTLEKVRQYFSSKQISLRPTKWLGDGWDCVPLAFNIASHEDVGGDGNGIEWVILSRTFQD
jgi:hypothetical protein